MGGAEILAGGEVIDEGKMQTRTMYSNFNVDIPLMVTLDSHDLFTSLSTN